MSKLFSDETLAHYGIVGQKKGIRRWQYPDGRFNEEGKERYFGSTGEQKKMVINKEFLKKRGVYNRDKQDASSGMIEDEHLRKGLTKYSEKLDTIANELETIFLPYEREHGINDKDYKIVTEHINKAIDKLAKEGDEYDKELAPYAKEMFNNRTLKYSETMHKGSPRIGIIANGIRYIGNVLSNGQEEF